jgi:hypothetical protein
MKSAQEVFEERGFTWGQRAGLREHSTRLGYVYSFGVMDEDLIHVYSSHRRFKELPKGTFAGCEADGKGCLIVTAPADDLVALREAIDRLDKAAQIFFRPPTAP